MIRTSLLVLFASLAVAGCTRSTDPLDWKIKCDDLTELQDWLGQNLPLMPPALAGEVAVCVNNIGAGTVPGPAGNPDRKNFRVCRQLDGHTVREVLIEGHELANRMLVARIANEADAVVRLLSTADTLSPVQLKQHEAIMNAHLAVKGSLERRLKAGEQRLAGLRTGLRANSP